MTDRLHRLFDRIEQLPATEQDEIAEQFEALAELYLRKIAQPASLPRPSYAGIWSDLPDDMEDELDRMRHEVPPTPIQDDIA